MARKPESAHVDWIRSKVRAAGIAYPVKIANDSENGMPDNLYIPSRESARNGGVSLWVEFKYIEKWPVRDSTVVKPSWNSGLQPIWAERIHSSDMKYAVVIFVGKGAKSECLWLEYDELDGLSKADCVERALTRQEIVDRIHKVTSTGAIKDGRETTSNVSARTGDADAAP